MRFKKIGNGKSMKSFVFITAGFLAALSASFIFSGGRESEGDFSYNSRNTDKGIFARRALDEMFSTPTQSKFSITCARGDTLAEILYNADISTEEVHNLISSSKRHFNPASLKVGQKIEIETVFEEGQRVVKSLFTQLPNGEKVAIARKDGQYFVEKSVLPTHKDLFYSSAKIEGSLYETAVKMGIPSYAMGKLVSTYRYDVDFQRDIKRGDTFSVIAEKYFDSEGNFVKFGNVIYASLDLRNKKHELYYHKHDDGRVEYYDETGGSVKKELLKTPISVARISSGFGMRRHPVLGYSRMHRGVDFAAPTGTPIYAAGDGVVSFSSRKSGYGNYLMIRHNGEYTTAYAHLSRFGSGIRPGTAVKQGQVVAYVGSTGMSTGPHLHFEVLRNGMQVNPMSVKFSSTSKLAANEAKRFNAAKASINQYVAFARSGGSTVASNAESSSTEVR